MIQGLIIIVVTVAIGTFLVWRFFVLLGLLGDIKDYISLIKAHKECINMKVDNNLIDGDTAEIHHKKFDEKIILLKTIDPGYFSNLSAARRAFNNEYKEERRNPMQEDRTLEVAV